MVLFFHLRGRDYARLPAYSLSVCNGQGGAGQGPKLEAESTIKFSHAGGRSPVPAAGTVASQGLQWQEVGVSQQLTPRPSAMGVSVLLPTPRLWEKPGFGSYCLLSHLWVPVGTGGSGSKVTPTLKSFKCGRRRW